MAASASVQLIPFLDSPSSRAELVRWLVKSEGAQTSEAGWAARLRHWWDENPWRTLVQERGWVLRSESGIAGFQGLIPAAYAVNGECRAAGVSSTWRVDSEFRNHSVAMLMQLKRFGLSRLLVDSTPTADVQVLLQKTGWKASKEVVQSIVAPCLLPSPQMGAGKRVTVNLDEVRQVAQPFTSAVGVERWITLDYLHWYARSVTRQHVFAGVVDAQGRLSSYVFLTPSRFGSWMEVDHFTTEGKDELLALVASLRTRLWIKLHAFPGDESWQGTRVLHRRVIRVCHYYLMPAEMEGLPQRTVLAEGDWGL